MVKYKLLQRNNDGNQKFKFLPIECGYYEALKQWEDKGWCQTIIDSEYLLRLIVDRYVDSDYFCLDSIVFNDTPDNKKRVERLNQLVNVNDLLEEIKLNPKQMAKLIFALADTQVEIKEISYHYINVGNDGKVTLGITGWLEISPALNVEFKCLEKSLNEWKKNYEFV